MNTMAKIPLMVLSFILSLILWVYVQVQANPQEPLRTSYTLPIVAKGLPTGLVVVSQPDSITIIPTGPIEERRLIKAADLSAFVDLSHVDPASAKDKVVEGTFPVHIAVSGDYPTHWLPRNPAIIRIDRVERNPVPVVVYVAGELLNKDYLYLPDSTYTEPRTVTVTGPKSQVDQVKDAWTEVDLSTVAPGKSYVGKVSLELKDTGQAPSSVRAEPDTVLIHPDIAVAPLARTLHVLPTYSGLPAVGYAITSIEVTPENVQVRGPSATIDGMSFLGTLPVDLSGIKQTSTLEAVPNLPPNVIISPLQPPPTISVKVVVVPTSQVSPPKSNPSPPKPRRRRRRPRT